VSCFMIWFAYVILNEDYKCKPKKGKKMFKMPVLVVIESLKAAKDEKSNNYADFLFTGGSISIPIDRAAFDQLKPLEGSEVTALFQMKPFQVVRFGRSVTVFEPSKFLELVEK
jgi:hypothetical protein